MAALRRGTPAVIGRIDEGRVVLDLRTVPADAEKMLARAIAAATGA
jgi:L-seryl-tRNA(Ser) seleniumtransferase